MKLLSALLVVAFAVVACGSQRPLAGRSAVAGSVDPAMTASLDTPVSAGSSSRVPVVPAIAAACVAHPASSATLAQLVGQKLFVAMHGTTPTAALLARIRRGEVGGVILFGSNITTKTALIALTGKLRAAAAAGNQPPLLIATDQEGGSVKRISWAPPTLSPPQMGRIGSTTTARDQGASTGSALRSLGINVDFAPVADVPASTASFMYQQGRTWSFSSTTTAALADAFATGLESRGVIPSMKHFPGLGYATRNTDDYVVSINASAAALAPGLRPYRTAIAHHVPLIMLSNASYTAYSAYPASWSYTIGVTILRHELGFTGATITDSLDGAARARGVTVRRLAVYAARAGADMILTTGSETSTTGVFDWLLHDVMIGTISTATLRSSYTRIMALKARAAGCS
ncbi:MAG TPA: glycoside hydrolase family 3 N-terminal domain-containing protein [Candidatus Limnocylindrales bacterium]|nr:glycoside hydrolase family 3 N-terminal domain-containing protein [Candidatus Limnocylindrales bacterium]